MKPCIRSKSFLHTAAGPMMHARHPQREYNSTFALCSLTETARGQHGRLAVIR